MGTFAKAPLSPRELYCAIHVEIEPEAVLPWDDDANSMDTIRLFILEAFKGLVKTTRYGSPRVQFIHESVRDFLLEENELGTVWPQSSGSRAAEEMLPNLHHAMS